MDGAEAFKSGDGRNRASMSINGIDIDELAMERRGSVPLEPDSVTKRAYYIVKLLVRDSPESLTDVMGGKRCLMHVEIDAMVPELRE